MASATHLPTTRTGIEPSDMLTRVEDASLPLRHQDPFVTTSVHQAAVETLMRWIDEMMETPDREDRLAVVIGEEGTGKTRLLVRVAQELMTRERCRFITLRDRRQQLTDAQLLRTIMLAFGGEPLGRTGLDLRGELRAMLLSMHQAGRQPGILIDGANFKGSHLELIRNLLRDALGTGLWMVLSGTPDLYLRMSRRRSLRGLMAPPIELAPLASPDLDRLLDGRVDAQRTGRPSEEVFAPDARDILHTWSRGNPARLVRITSECLAAANAQGSETVTPAIARQVTRQLTIDEANQARAAVMSRVAQSAVQTPMPFLLDETSGRLSSATSQQALWREEGTS